jgi:hypothetical protein
MAARRAQRPGRHSERDLRIAEVEVLDEERRELIPGDVRRLRVLIALAEGDEVIPPRDELAAGVDAARQGVLPARAIHLVAHVVLTRPQQLDRCAADLIGDGRGRAAL